MCQNLAWQMCAATGKLPGQQGPQFRFAVTPSSLSVDEWNHPRSWPCESGCPDGKFAINDVFFVELAVFRAICTNAAAVLAVDRGQLITCEVDTAAYNAMAERLLASA